jgi:hypothetical protein
MPHRASKTRPYRENPEKQIEQMNTDEKQGNGQD